ncbi:hypothetical protein LTS18_010248, partial [Coniosporium uncinatum]
CLSKRLPSSRQAAPGVSRRTFTSTCPRLRNRKKDIQERDGGKEVLVKKEDEGFSSTSSFIKNTLSAVARLASGKGREDTQWGHMASRPPLELGAAHNQSPDIGTSEKAKAGLSKPLDKSVSKKPKGKANPSTKQIKQPDKGKDDPEETSAASPEDAPRKGRKRGLAILRTVGGEDGLKVRSSRLDRAAIRRLPVTGPASKGIASALAALRRDAARKGAPKKEKEPKLRIRRVMQSSATEDAVSVVSKRAKHVDEQDISIIAADSLEFAPLDIEQRPVPQLSYGLDRVLFNPGVYHLQDPRSRVYNFDPYLQKIMPVNEFEFNSLGQYVTSSKDRFLSSVAKEHGKKYVGSTSSMTDMLKHFHYLVSAWRPLNVSMLSQSFAAKNNEFTTLQRAPIAVFLRWQTGTYAIDADKQFDSANILMMLGRSLEKLLTMPKHEFEKFRRSNPEQVSE